MACTRTHRALSALLVLAGLAAPASAKSLRQVGEATTASVERSLAAELAINASAARLAELRAALRPMYTALPKVAGGHLGHQAVRYALHRLLLQRHGWFIVGLEPSDEALPPYLSGDWVPEYLQGLLEERLGGRGMQLHEVAALAAALEDLVHAEAADRVGRVSELLSLPAALNVEEARRLLETYMIMYLDGGNFSAPSTGLEEMTTYFKKEYEDWAAIETWMQEVVRRALRGAGNAGLDREAAVRMADEMGQRFGAFNDGECSSLKAELLGMESHRPGRVLLRDFYQKGLYSHWAFDEKIGYLRALGALDESDPARPSVIVTNYLASRTNCLKASSLYSICCRNECEDLTAHLEARTAAPSAPPLSIQQLLTELPTDSRTSPPVFSETLIRRLHQIAERHGGQVPLYGRLFAQWMHHAFPRECPYPHEGINPQTPEEWLREAGEGRSAKASEEEVRHFLGECESTGGCLGPPSRSASGEAVELPWSDAEHLLAGPAPVPWGLGAALRALAALVAIALLAPRLLAGSDQDCSTGSLGGEVPKPSAAGQKSPWQVALFTFAMAVFLEAVGLLHRTAFVCTLGGGLLVASTLSLLAQAQKPRSKGKECLL